MRTTTMTLIEFLTARLDEDEAVAIRIINADEDLAAGRARSMLIYACWDEAAHVALGAGRVLAEVEAKRRIVAEWQGWSLEVAHEGIAVLKALVLPYADHSDFDEAWRP